MQNLTVTLIQTPLHWESASANRAMLEEKIWSINQPTDLIILPEMFTTGFSMNAAALAEVMNFETFKWMKQMASQTGAVVVGSVIIKEGSAYYNRLIWMRPDGTYESYDKRHLFRMAEEDKVYTSGEKKIIPVLKGWKILPLICYDLRFPVWSRNKNNGYDLLVYVANWPGVRSHAWNTLLKARAIENISYVAGVNRVGEDGKGLTYSGDSAVIDFKGETIFNAADKDCVQTIQLDAGLLQNFREKFPAHLDSDAFNIE
jgi:predicted amidohydrolase